MNGASFKTNKNSPRRSGSGVTLSTRCQRLVAVLSNVCQDRSNLKDRHRPICESLQLSTGSLHELETTTRSLGNEHLQHFLERRARIRISPIYANSKVFNEDQEGERLHSFLSPHTGRTKPGSRPS